MDTETLKTIVIVALVILMVVVAVFEVKFLRSRRKKKMETADLPDLAHNALISTKVISRTLAKNGVRSEEAENLMKEAQMAYDRRNYRVCMEISDKVKNLLKEAKLAREKEGDIAKLSKIRGIEETKTVKELLQREMPKDYAQSKFSISVAREAIEHSKKMGRNVIEAERLLSNAEICFDAQDYSSALALALRSKKSAEGGMEVEQEVLKEIPEVPLQARKCVSCGVSLESGDNFCRKCGAKVKQAMT